MAVYGNREIGVLGNRGIGGNRALCPVVVDTRHCKQAKKSLKRRFTVCARANHRHYR